MYKTIDSVDRVLKESQEKQVLILKHSTACPISHRVKREVDAFLEEYGRAEVYLVVVQEERRISSELAQRLGVAHESPQFLIISRGKVALIFNHFNISKKSISQVLKVL